ncbi:DUF7283 family protein [Salinigranum halophilum]|jgi:hypothetical protein|uniref:DUF7283 family protein n=1 Tax=Salinigranum halophilum TaxID=2565931 RepID=UPI0010A75BFB|nr:hypothetical protein [Salinigranum halophilum]
MFDTPIDAWYAWLGLAAATLVVFGVVSSLPTTPAPDAPAVAETVDAVATSEYETTATRALDARAVRIGPRRIGLRTDAGTAHATLGYRVVPVEPGTTLARVLRGQPPAAVFTSRATFERAVDTARDRARDPAWRPAGRHLVVRRLSWDGVDVTLVGTLDSRPGGV